MSDFTTSSPSHELNLTAHRTAGTSVWNRRGWDGSADSTLARWLIGSAGGALAVIGLRRRGPAGCLLATIGSSLAWWAVTADGGLPATRHRMAVALDRAWQPRTDAVQDASADSFPASDAPSWTPTVGVGLRRHETVR